MKKFQKTILVPLVLLVSAVFFVACGTTHDAFTAEKVKAAYEAAEFTVTEYSEASTYDTLNLLEISNIDKVYIVSKGNDAALVIVFDIPGNKIPGAAITKMLGDGYGHGKGNVQVCRYTVNSVRVTTTGSYDTDSPEIKALNKPLDDAKYDRKIK